MAKKTKTAKVSKPKRAKKAAPVVALMKREERNGARKPIKGACADVWAWMDAHRDADTAALRAWAEKKGFNVSNALQERAAFRRFHGITTQEVKQAA